MFRPDLLQHPLTEFFLSSYLAHNTDAINFPLSGGSAVFDRYEEVLREALKALRISKESLRARPEFNFDSADSTALEAGIATLRVANDLQRMEHTNIQLITPKKGRKGADLLSEKSGKRVCIEVKALTKAATGGTGKFIDQQLYDKVFDLIGGVRSQLFASADELKCDLKIAAFVVNWFDQSIYLGESDYLRIVNGLENEYDKTALSGVDGILFITSTGCRHFFLEDTAKCLSC